MGVSPFYFQVHMGSAEAAGGALWVMAIAELLFPIVLSCGYGWFYWDCILMSAVR